MFFAVRTLPITHFVLSVKWYESRRGVAAINAYPGEHYLKSANVGKLARTAFQESSSLRYCFLELAGQDMSYWRLDRDSGGGDAEELSMDSAVVAMGGEKF